MVYIEYFSKVNPKGIIEIVRRIHEKYPALNYLEMLDKLPQHKYQYYLDIIVIGGVRVSAGKYHNYDKVSGTFDILPMFELRVNPNKYFDEEWFQELLKELLSVNASYGMLRRYDYAVDIPLMPKFVEVLNSRKEKGLYKGTRYFGQAGRHGHLRIYDKQKELKADKEDAAPLTRVEHTLFSSEKPSLEEVYILDDSSLNVDYSALKDTDKAIVEMYLQLKALGYNYNLKLGRGKMSKLAPYISGSYVKLEYGDILDRLIDNIKKVFHVDGAPEQEAPEADADGFMQISDDEIKEIDELFGG